MEARFDFSDAPNIDRIIGSGRAHLRCLYWGDLGARFLFGLAKPNLGGFRAPRMEPLMKHEYIDIRLFVDVNSSRRISQLTE